MKVVGNKYYDDYSESIFLDTLYGKSVNVYLLSGVKLFGEFYGHDIVSICLKRDNSEQIVYKSAVSSISHVKANSQNTLNYN